MRVLGLDLGARRIGLAVSDSAGSIAFPAGFLERHDPERDLAELGSLIREREIECVVVGLPVHMNGQRGHEAQAAQRFARHLSEATGLRVDTLDERWTTRQAERALAHAPRAKRRRRGLSDSLAATLLLQSYLQRTRVSSPDGEDS